MSHDQFLFCLQEGADAPETLEAPESSGATKLQKFGTEVLPVHEFMQNLHRKFPVPRHLLCLLDIFVQIYLGLKQKQS